jgi:hypothetical protein
MKGAIEPGTINLVELVVDESVGLLDRYVVIGNHRYDKYLLLLQKTYSRFDVRYYFL